MKNLTTLIVYLFVSSFLMACENAAPVITSTAITTATEDVAYSYTLSATDKDSTILTWSATSGSTLPSWLTLEEGSLTPVVLTDDAPNPQGIAIDESDNVYVVSPALTQTGSDVILRITPDGTTTTFANIDNIHGRFTLGLLVVGKKLFISTLGNGIYTLDLDNPSAGTTLFSLDPRRVGAMVEKDGYLYFANNGASTIDKIEIANPANQTTVITGFNSPSSIEIPYGLDFDPAGNLYVTLFASKRLVRHNLGTDGSFTLDSGFNGTGYIEFNHNPSDVRVDASGNIYVSTIQFFQSNALNDGITRFRAGSLERIEITSSGDTWSFGINSEGALVWGDFKGFVYKLETSRSVLTGIPSDADVGEHPVSITVSDGKGEDTQEFTITVSNINDEPTGSVTIAGTATEDEMLTASNDLADDDGLGDITYQWNADGVAIADATSSTYTLTQAEVGKAITATAIYTDVHGTDEAVTSDPSAAVANVNDTPTGDVSITGTAAQNEVLTAVTDTVADADGLGAITYQWNADGNAITDATASTYTLTQSDVGVTLTVTASYTDDQGTDESLSSESTAAVTNVNDAPTGSVTIAGIAAEDQVLMVSNNLVDADGLGTIVYQWQADGVALAGANANVYALTPTDIGKFFTVTAMYTDAFGTVEMVSSAATAAVVNINDAPTGSVTITGNPIENEMLSASNDLADEDGLGTITYQWNADGAAIAGATSNVYTLSSAEVNKVITVTANYTDAFGTAESVTSSPTAPVADVNTAPSGSVTITGTAAEDEMLTTSNDLADDDGLGTITYQWKADTLPITGATTDTYTLTQSEVDKVITVTASYTDDQGTDETVTSSPTTAVANVNDTPTGTVTISGIATEGETLTASNTLADVDGLGTITYQWNADTVAITGATASTYALMAAEIGKTITVTASYTDGFGTDESVTSSATLAVLNVNDLPTGSVTITGTANEGETLTASNTLADVDGLGTITYQWNADTVAITGATASTYTLMAAEIGKTITVTASYTDGFGTDESVTSSATAAVVNVNDAPTGSVTITGTATEGETLTASNTLADVDGLGTITYQWNADTVAITGATASTYTLMAAEIGKTITVTASYTDGQGTDETVTSDATAMVVASTVTYATIDLSGVGNGTGGLLLQGDGVNVGLVGVAHSSGDVNGDGLIDLILGAPSDNLGDGAVYVVFGVPGGLSTDIDLANVGTSVDGFKINGVASSSGQMGSSVSFVGDMNGDGMGEIIAGATGLNIGTGGSYVIFGKASTTAVNLATLATDNNGFEILADSFDMFNGWSVSAAGDVNGDTFADVVVGSHFSALANGLAYVVFGKSTSTAIDLSVLGTAGHEGFLVNGDFLENAGYSVASAGDLTGDGKSELIISAPDDPSDTTTEGKTYVVLGKDTNTTVDLSTVVTGGTNDAGGFVIIGEKNDDFSGDSVANAGDVNNDGINDLIIGASFFSSDGGTTRTGRAYVVFGTSSMTMDINLVDIAAGMGGFIINHDVIEDARLGTVVAAAGDINGDGFDDVVIGAPRTNVGTSAGAAYIVFGKASAVTNSAVNVSDLINASGGFAINGVANDFAGSWVSNAGDVNADGKLDLLIGARGNGKVYVVFGQ